MMEDCTRASWINRTGVVVDTVVYVMYDVVSEHYAQEGKTRGERNRGGSIARSIFLDLF